MRRFQDLHANGADEAVTMVLRFIAERLATLELLYGPRNQFDALGAIRADVTVLHVALHNDQSVFADQVKSIKGKP